SSAASPWFSAQTFTKDLDETKVPGIPLDLKCRSQKNSLGVSWAPPTNSHVVVRGYQLGFGEGVPDVYKLVLDSRKRYHVIKDLKPNTEYILTLRASNDKGEGEPFIDSCKTGP
ncbi:hypothetical protein HELRODRAFT_137230, partial [Helobdella robusta]|uniref:Fibronectin type-III domain-containing protein n=1 Tax=Helobdella robusta TaxID=6412 RepID=T1EII4_HELRO